MKQYFILTILLFSFQFGTAKVRLIDIKQTLEGAKQISTVIIYGYSDSLMFYGILGSLDTVRINCTIRKYAEQYRSYLVDNKRIPESNLAGKWPDKGDTILLIIGERKRVELFAKRVSGKYRFWDPNSIPFANSVFLIPKEKPYYQLSNCRDMFTTGYKDRYSCEDGCFVDINAIKEHS